MGVTQNLKLPYPELTDVLDGPDAISDLASATEGYFYNRTLPPGVVRTPSYFWGSGTAFPTTGVMTGDTYHHTGLNSLMVYVNGAWRQTARAAVVDTAALNALTTNYKALLHQGFRVAVGESTAGTGLMAEWNGAKWRMFNQTFNPGLMPLWGGAGVRVSVSDSICTIHWDVYNKSGTTLTIKAWETYPIVGSGNIPAPALSGVSGAFNFSNSNSYELPAFAVGATTAGELVVVARWSDRIIVPGAWLLGTLSYPLA